MRRQRDAFDHSNLLQACEITARCGAKRIGVPKGRVDGKTTQIINPAVMNEAQLVAIL